MKNLVNEDPLAIRSPGRIPKESFHFTVGDELWTIKMRKQAIQEACMEIRLVGGRSLLAHTIEGVKWSPLIFLSDVLGVEVIANMPANKAKIFETICCKNSDIDKTMQVFMLFVSRLERTAIDSLEHQTKKEYKGILVGNWHPLKLLSKVFKDVMIFYLDLNGEGYEKKDTKNTKGSKRSGKKRS
jgi:hypothetical protein